MNKTLDENKRPLKTVNAGGIARTKGGEWDAQSNRVRVEDVYIIKGMIQRFELGMEWEETEYYQNLYQQFTETNKHEERGFNNLESYLEKRCRNYDMLFNEIKSNGYREGHIGSHLGPEKIQPIRDRLEVLVVIDRNGDVNFFEGNHRFGIAWVLDLVIPAHVVCRHKQWQKVRDDIHNNGITGKYGEMLRNHPDLQDLIN